MEQGMAGASDPQVQMLSAYRDITRKMLQLLNSPEENTELVDVEGLDQLLLERELLINSYPSESVSGSPSPAIEKLVAEIQGLESSVRYRMQSIQSATSDKLKGFQGQKKGMSAYQSHYQTDAAFIDHRSK